MSTRFIYCFHSTVERWKYRLKLLNVHTHTIIEYLGKMEKKVLLLVKVVIHPGPGKLQFPHYGIIKTNSIVF